MSSSSANIIIDDTRSDAFSYRGAWSTSQVDQWFNSTLSSPNTTSSSVTMTFNGTSVAFMGTTPPPSNPQSFLVSIDNNTPVNTSFSDPNPPSYRQWYQTPPLSDGPHTITLSNLTNSSLDFALVTVGPKTPIATERIVVDDTDSAITFSSYWRTDRDKFNVGGSVPISGFTLGNSTHDTATVGSSFSYTFNGKAIAVYGLFDFSSPSLLVLSFSIDSQALVQKYPVSASSPQLVAEVGQQPNYKFYSYDFLESGEHTLVVNVTQCVNTTFRVDYLAYVPTFATLSQMPNTASGGSGAGSSSGTGGGGRRTGPGVIAAIVVVIGSVLLGVFLFLWLRRSRRRINGGEIKNTTISPNPSTSGRSNAPLLPTSSPSPTLSVNNANPWTTSTPSPLRPSSTPNTNTLGPMAQMQNASAVQYGLSFPHTNDQSGISWDTGEGQTVNVDPPSYDEVTSAPLRT